MQSLALLGQVFAIIAPVLLCTGVGYVWGWLRRPFDPGITTALVSAIAAPCLIFNALTRLEVSAAALAQLAAATLACFVAMGVLGWVVLRLAHLPAHSYLPALMFPNGGNVGLPLCFLAFGAEGLALGIAWFAVGAVGQFTVGINIAAGSFAIGKLVRQPIIYAIALAFVFILTGHRPPVWLGRTTEILGNMLIPLMLLSLGVSLATLKVTRPGRAAALSALRLVGGFSVGLAVAWAFGLAGAARGVLIIQSAMPVAIFNYLFALQYKREPADVAGMIVITTVVSFISLPALLLYVLP
ncbi:AEC family transporter [Vineibacter terrae]|uniref:AEC family transporter n=1 Tax=Vineibacter terrae TaxID=2586908 RepID=A0A5C8PV84_9HYPH|nr:AEC family transporter [Vineibacter terrae]TXL81971.1 AEC family transporter [Vineibacter terrae]